MAIFCLHTLAAWNEDRSAIPLSKGKKFASTPQRKMILVLSRSVCYCTGRVCVCRFEWTHTGVVARPMHTDECIERKAWCAQRGQ